jgi:hypothetical protein
MLWRDLGFRPTNHRPRDYDFGMVAQIALVVAGQVDGDSSHAARAEEVARRDANTNPCRQRLGSRRTM